MMYCSAEAVSVSGVWPMGGGGGGVPPAKFFFPRQFRTPSTNSFAYSQSELHDMNMNDLRLRNKSTHARGLVI